MFNIMILCSDLKLTECLLLISLCNSTASSGEQWIGDINHRGEYAPIGMNAKSNGPTFSPISNIL